VYVTTCFFLDKKAKLDDNSFIMKAGRHNQTNQKPQSFCFEGHTLCLPALAYIAVTAGLLFKELTYETLSHCFQKQQSF